MTFNNFWIDLWLSIRYGQWYVHRVPFISGPTKHHYYACCDRSKDMILCSSKREAEGVVAIHNDSRGLEDINPNGT